MEIKFKSIILRDSINSDIYDYIYWCTFDVEWMRWDAPWESKPLTRDCAGAMAQSYIKRSQENERVGAMRKRFEISGSETGRHLGWVCMYYIDDKYQYTKEHIHLAVGIDIPNVDERGKGFGFNALTAFLQYMRENNIDEVYIQTWSGNLRMIRLAEKLGFIECDRKVGERLVDGSLYDGITFHKSLLA